MKTSEAEAIAYLDAMLEGRPIEGTWSIYAERCEAIKLGRHALWRMLKLAEVLEAAAEWRDTHALRTQHGVACRRLFNAIDAARKAGVLPEDE